MYGHLGFTFHGPVSIPVTETESIGTLQHPIHAPRVILQVSKMVLIALGYEAGMQSVPVSAKCVMSFGELGICIIVAI